MGIREVFRTQGPKLEVRIILNYSGEKIVLQEGEEDNIVAGKLVLSYGSVESEV
jgi:hypothetical protein